MPAFRGFAEKDRAGQLSPVHSQNGRGWSSRLNSEPDRETDGSPTTEDLLTFLELHGRTAHDRCGELFIRSEFDRLIAVLMAHTYVSMLPQIHRTGSAQNGVELGERIEFARRTLRDCNTYWFIEEGDDDDSDAFRFFHNLARGTVEDFWIGMSPEVETFWASQGLYEDGAFMRYLTPALTVIRQFLDDNAGVAQRDEAGA